MLWKNKLCPSRGPRHLNSMRAKIIQGRWQNSSGIWASSKSMTSPTLHHHLLLTYHLSARENWKEGGTSPPVMIRSTPKVLDDCIVPIVPLDMHIHPSLCCFSSYQL